MIFSHFPISSLLAHLKQYDIMLANNCKSKENILRFREECLIELQRKYGLYKTK